MLGRLKDVSLSSLTAGLIVLLVGMTSSAILIFQAAQTVGVDTNQASSWLGSICLGMGIVSIYLSLRYRAPVLLAWSTPGAALLIGSLKGVPLSDAIGAFVVSAILILISGMTGAFERLMNRIPLALASALLAGVLLHFALDAFSAFKLEPALIGAMFVAYVVGKRFWPRYTMVIVLFSGTLAAIAQGQFKTDQVRVAATQFSFVLPTFSLQALLGVAIPLFIVTMASQNLTGVAVMRANGYDDIPVSRVISWSGFTNLVIAPFGGFALNLAAITAAIAMGPESHPDPKKRYVAGVFSGLLYAVVGLFAATVVSVFSAFPAALVLGIAGFALLPTIANSLQNSLASERHREASFITFAVTASGLSLFGIGSAFWGLTAGALCQAFFRLTSRASS